MRWISSTKRFTKRNGEKATAKILFTNKESLKLRGIGLPSSRCRPPPCDIPEKHRQEARQMLIESGTTRFQNLVVVLSLNFV